MKIQKQALKTCYPKFCKYSLNILRCIIIVFCIQTYHHPSFYYSTQMVDSLYKKTRLYIYLASLVYDLF